MSKKKKGAGAPDRSPSTRFRRRHRRNTKYRRLRTAFLNWLNGLPVDGEEEAARRFEAGSLASSTVMSPSKKSSFRGGLFGKELLSRKRSKLSTCASSVAQSDDNGSTAGNEGKAPEPQRLPLRIIQLVAHSSPLPPMPSASLKGDEANPQVSNQVRTAKYSLFTFLPKNLFEQFRRVANFYFLILVLLQAIPQFNNTNLGLAAAPIVAIVAVTAIKDAVEDWRRHKSDEKVNHQVTQRLKRGKGRPLPENPVLLPAKSKSSKTRIWQRARRHLKMMVPSIPRKMRLARRQCAEPILEAQADPRLVDWHETYWKDIGVGDIVLLKNNEAIPADLLILSSSEPDGQCYVETKNLDGETNLKIRRGPLELQWIRRCSDAASLNAVIEAELPSSSIYSFYGRITFPKSNETSNEEIVVAGDGTKAVPINADGILLRGCILRNTEWVVGVAIYTGAHTKIVLNSGMTPSKRSRIERQMNPQIILNFVILFIICFVCALVQGGIAGGASSHGPFWYTGGSYSASLSGFLTFWSCLILFQTIVPISLYITVEMCKTVQAFFIYNDRGMYYAETENHCVPRAWNISDDLGQIEYLFSDKTGTLTQNVMEFRRCSINGTVYGYIKGQPSATKAMVSGCVADRAAQQSLDGIVDQGKWEMLESQMTEKLRRLLPYDYIPPSQPSFVDPKMLEDIEEKGEQCRKIVEFFTLLAVCHTVLIEKKHHDEYEAAVRSTASSTKSPLLEGVLDRPDLLLYKAQSPDEAALVSSARDLGFVFLQRNNDELTISVFGDHETITVLNVLEFSSNRKRMSAIVRRADGRIMLLCKGADSVIYERLAGLERQALTKETEHHLDHFAEDGLRTLCLAQREFTKEEYAHFSLRYLEASTAMHNRDFVMDAVADEVEQSLHLLGATAIEDRLQDGVPECIELLQSAGIKIWVLTGDKMETAINIGFACRLLRKDMTLIVVKANDVEATLKQLREAYEQIWGSFFSFGAAPINRKIASSEQAYGLIIDGLSLKHAFEPQCRKLFLDLACKCRAVVCCRVSPLQKAKVVELVKVSKNVMTLAIGDGANDVSMIQTADVGVGISGQEGMQAVMSSDYAIAQFRFLTRLLLIHGRWSYIRIAGVTLCAFYKNVALVMVLFWYQFYCNFTGQWAFDYMYLLFYNLFFSILPILALGFFDHDLTTEYALRVPAIYELGIRQTSYSMKLFALYILDAVYQSVASFYIPYLAYRDTAVAYAGYGEDMAVLGNAMAFTVIICVNMVMAMATYSWSIFMFNALANSIGVLFVFLIVFSLIPQSALIGSYMDLIQPRFLATVFLAIFVALAPRIILRYLQVMLRPTNLDIVREIQKTGKNESELFEMTKAEMTLEDRNDWKLERAATVIEPPEKPITPNALKKGMDTLYYDSFMFERHNTTLPAHMLEEHAAHPSAMPADSAQRHLGFFNMNTGGFERIRGFAFSQEAGMRNVVTGVAFGSSIPHHLHLNLPQAPTPAAPRAGDWMTQIPSFEDIPPPGPIPNIEPGRDEKR